MEQNQIKFLSLDDMWGIKGRMGRLHYMLTTVRIFALGLVLISLVPVLVNLVAALGVTPQFAHGVLIGLTLVGLTLANLSIIMRRVQDIGFPYWSVFIVILLSMMVPSEPTWAVIAASVVIVAMQVALLVVPGDESDNEYGATVENREAPATYMWMKPNTQGIAVFGMMFIFMTLIYMIFGSYIPKEYVPEGMHIEEILKEPEAL